MIEMLSKIADVAKVSEKLKMENYKKIKPKGNITVEKSKSFWSDFFKKEKMDNKIGEQKPLLSKMKMESMKDNVTDQKNEKNEINSNKIKENSNDQSIHDEVKEEKKSERAIDQKQEVDAETTKESENLPKEGGNYEEVARDSEGGDYEVHHMPADSVSYLDRNDGPAIRMEKADHLERAIDQKQEVGAGTTKESEKLPKEGGSYKEVARDCEGGDYEVHHMPADSVSYLDRNDGPAIRMEKADHRQTASCGNSREAREYRAKQKELIDQGKFREAIQMDIDDIREKFGNKYDGAIKEMLKYVDKLEAEGKIHG